MGGHRMTLRTALTLPSAAVVSALLFIVLPVEKATARAQITQAGQGASIAQVQSSLRIMNLNRSVPSNEALNLFKQATIESGSKNPAFILYRDADDPSEKNLNDLYYRSLRLALQQARSSATLVVVDSNAHPYFSRGNQTTIEGVDRTVLPFATALIDNKLIKNFSTTLVTTANSGKDYSIILPGVAIQNLNNDPDFNKRLMVLMGTLVNEAFRQYRSAHPSSFP